MIETYLQKLNPRAIEKYNQLPLDTREDVEARFNYHEECCAKCDMPPDRLWLLEVIEHATKEADNADAIDFLDAIGEPITY